MEHLKAFADSFEEIHYLIGGFSVGFLVGCMFGVVVCIVIFKNIRKK